MATAKDWARGFATQATADFNAWNALQLYLHVPAESSFSILNQLLADSAGRVFLKLVKESAHSLLRSQTAAWRS